LAVTWYSSRKRSGPPSDAAAARLPPRAATRYNHGTSVMLLPPAAEPAVMTCPPDPAPLLAVLVTAGEAALQGTTAPSLLPVAGGR
jgi:hypothetical protein